MGTAWALIVLAGCAASRPPQPKPTLAPHSRNASPVEAWPSEAPTVAVTRYPTTTPYTQQSIAVWADGTVRFECGASQGYLGNPLHHEESIFVRGSVSPESVQAVLANLEQLGSFGLQLQVRAQAASEAVLCASWDVALHSSTASNELWYYGCDNPTKLFVDTLATIRTLFDNPPCELSCHVFRDCPK